MVKQTRSGLISILLVSVLMACGGLNQSPPQTPEGNDQQPIRPLAEQPVTVLYNASLNTPYPYADLGLTYAKFLKNLLGRYPDLNVTIKTASSYVAGSALTTARTFYIGSTYDEAVPAALMNDINAGAPVTWISQNIWQLLWAPNNLGLSYVQMHTAYTPTEYTTSFNLVDYRGYTFNKYLAPMDMIELSTTAPSVTVHAWARDATNRQIPYAVQSGNFWYVADNPFTYMHATDRYLVFADLIGPMMGHPETCAPRAVMRLEDTNANDDPVATRDTLDVLQRTGIKFSAAVIPRYIGTGGTVVNWNSRPLMKTQLLRIEPMGGRVFEHGYTHQFGALLNPNGTSDEDAEFWNIVLNTPITGMTVTSAKNRINTGKSALAALGLHPVGWISPHYATNPDYQAPFASLWPIEWERPWFKTGAVVAGQLFPYPVKDINGFLQLPENMSGIEDNNTPANALELARANKVLHCPWIGFFFHPYLLEADYLGADRLTPAQFEQFINDLKALGYTFVDAATVTLP
jgi:uncharacterized protein YdaL